MLCSISSRKSNSNWLDRLRSSKGFSTGAGAVEDSDTDLGHFLATQIQPDPQPHFTSGQSPAPAPALELQTPQLLGNVLAELFAFGPDTSNFPSKKAPRKMANPRSCKVKKEVVVEKTMFVGEEEEKMDWNLSGFSRTEVAVIDTSYKGWKFEKVLFRKKSVWKVRDRKSRVLNFEDNEKKKMKMQVKMKMKMKKKRKLSVEEEEGGVRKKKKKSFLGQCSLSKEGKRGEFSIRTNDEENSREKLIC